MQVIIINSRYTLLMPIRQIQNRPVHPCVPEHQKIQLKNQCQDDDNKYLEAFGHGVATWPNEKS
jgi:hypothetical protein